MKKSVLLLAATFGVTGAFAQDLTDKKGRAILPEAGDWGISVDATKFIDFAADLAHPGAAGTKGAPTFDPLNNKFSLTGRYFKDATTAYKGTIRLYNQTNTTAKFINKLETAAPPATTPNWPNNVDPEQVKDVQKTRDWAVGIGGGLEKRKGSKYRLQGYYGAEAALIIAGGGEKYSYGNDVVVNGTASNADNNLGLYSTDFGGNISLAPGDHDERTLVQRDGKTIALAVRGYAGVEYFFSSKMSIGGEFGWGLGWSRTGRGSKTVEGLDLADDAGNPIATGTVVGDTKEKSGDVTRGWFLGNDRDNAAATNPKQLWMNSFSPAGNLSLNFYF
jgi:hypothetical protein